MATPVTRYGSIAGIENVGVRAEALQRFDAPQKNAALDGVTATMNGYFRKKFTLPFMQVGADVHRCASILAAYDLLSSRGLSPDGRDQNIIDRADAEMKWLENVAKGLVVPDVTDSSPAAVEGVQSGGPRVISASSRGYSVRGTCYPRGPFQGS